ncbi:ABC transporter permease [Jonesia quinghaiensis]|uniref:ABC transporter permease n=1 Tax=Jonesia quinghaiensis TaxID=262806 RepID=UPI0003F800C7|nr:ABC transporter permease [Jonesia quinghaiensis]
MRIFVDTFQDCAIDMTARLQRTLLLIIAVALGAGTFVMSLGSNVTASQQIANDMAAGTLDQISVAVSGGTDTNNFPDDADARALTLPMVLSSGRRIDVDIDTAQPNRFTTANVDEYVQGVAVAGVTTGYFDVMDLTGGTAGAWVLDSTQHTNVAYLGVQAAKELGIPTDTPYPSGYQISLAGHRVDVVGIVQSSERARVDNVILVPYAQAVAMKISDSEAVLTVRTAIGAGGPVSKALRQVVRPDAPERLTVTQVATLDSLRSGVDSQLSRLGMSVGVMLLALTTLLIANSMIVAVMSRTSEIGLRRALGASQGDIARLFLTEGAITGFLGGLAGAALGVVGTLVTALANGWSVTMPLWLPFIGLGIGTVVGILASVYPATSAARINPATAIRVD